MIGKLIYKDILRRMKNPTGILVLTLIPVAFTLLLGLIFAPQGNQSAQPKVHLLIEDHDNSFVSNFLTGAFNREEMSEMFAVEMIADSTGQERMNQGKASALLIIPPAFGDSLLNNHPTSLELVQNPSESFGPKIAKETLSIIVEGGNRLLRLADRPIGIIRRGQNESEDLSEADIALIAIQIYQLTNNFENYLIPPKIELQTQTEETSKDAFDMGLMFAYILPGILVMCLLFSMEIMARDMFSEQDNHTLYRIKLSPVPLHDWIISKFLFFMLIGFISFVAVWIIGDCLMGISLSRLQWIQLIGFSLSLLAALAGIINLLYSLIRTRNQAQASAPAVILFFSMLGGSMIPFDSLPSVMQKIAVISPVYWGIQGLLAITVHKSGWIQLLKSMMILSSIAVVFISSSFVFYYRKFKA